MTQSLPSKHLVIYADDDQDDVELVRDSFEKYAQNVELVSFEDGNHALQFLTRLAKEDTTPCLIILDINLPGVDGKELLKAIRDMDHYQDTPVVLFTTSSQPTDKSFARNLSAGFMTKPLSFKQMDIITDQFIEHCADDIKKKIRKQLG
jgi:CheY-like chemotaxis protein